MISRLLLGGLIFLTATTAQGEAPVEVFVLAGQSNMEGQAVVDLKGKDYNEGRGTLEFLLREPVHRARMGHLWPVGGAPTIRDDVWCRYRRESGPLLQGPLSVGFSVYGDRHHFGPELQFGHIVGDQLASPVLLVKTAWGGKSLYRDFRPPSAGGEVGSYYTRMVAEIREALGDRDGIAELAGRERRLAGFVWYHGWNDGVDPRHAIPEYEDNVVHLLSDIRREFGAPELPCVIGELTGPWVDAPEEWAKLREAQRRAASRPELGSHVRFAETHDFVRRPEDSPNPTHGHHEFGNAETYFLVGDALGKKMVELIGTAADGAQPEKESNK